MEAVKKMWEEESLEQVCNTGGSGLCYVVLLKYFE
jgi:hypothetical protein